MDIFNRKKVEELEVKLLKTECERDKYRSELWALEQKFAEMGKLEEPLPSDCVRGPWCWACEFVRTFHHVKYRGMGEYETDIAYVCSKSASCKNFVQKEAEGCLK